MTRVDKLLDHVKGMCHEQKPLFCRLPDGTEKSMDLIEAMTAGAQFIRMMDGSHDLDELLIAVLNNTDEDFSDLEELADQ